MNEAAVLAGFMDRKWRLPVLALLSARKGEKFVTLFRTLGASQVAMRRTLDGLIEEGLVTRNPGYGHPMRPEYILTDAGKTIGEACDALAAVLRQLEVLDVALSKWSLPILFVLKDGQMRFSELASVLPGATDRALANGLRSLVAHGLVDREVADTYPPSVSYRLSRKGREVDGPLHSAVALLSVGT